MYLRDMKMSKSWHEQTFEHDIGMRSCSSLAICRRGSHGTPNRSRTPFGHCAQALQARTQIGPELFQHHADAIPHSRGEKE